MLFKKIASVFLTIALIVTASSVVSADDAVSTELFKVETEAVTTASTLSVSPILYTPGEKITVRFSAAQNTGITSLKLMIKFNNSILEFNDCKSLNLFDAKNEYIKLIEDNKNGNYLLFYSENYPNISDKIGAFAEATFTVKDVCADNVSVEALLFQGQKANCTVMGRSGLQRVPFESGSNSFSIHKISAENSTVTVPTCTEQGFTTYKCATCGKDIKGNITEALGGHTPDEAVEENRVEPTCTENGSYNSVVYCSICGEQLSNKKKIIDALGHDLKHTDAKAATCTAIGWEAYDECTREGCDYTTYKEIPATGHTAAEAVEEKRVEPTCTENGSYDSVVYCKICNAELSREKKTIDALGHDLKHTDAKAATCTAIGWEAYDECMREGCGYTTYKEIPATGHTEGAAVKENLIEATCTENGSYDSVVRCSTCGEELSREKKTIEATGHKYGEATVIEPTYKEGGYSIHKCEVCGYEEKFDIKPALEYTPGDVNNDGVVDSKDALLVLRANSGLAEITPLMEVAGDLNGDGVVDSKDALLILRTNSGLKAETEFDDKKTA